VRHWEWSEWLLVELNEKRVRKKDEKGIGFSLSRRSHSNRFNQPQDVHEPLRRALLLCGVRPKDLPALRWLW
jgi:hypothetical protein